MAVHWTCFTIFKHKIRLHYCHTRSLCVYFYLICAENKSLSTLKGNKSKGWFIYLEESYHLMMKDSLAKRRVDERYFIWKSDSFFLDQVARQYPNRLTLSVDRACVSHFSGTRYSFIFVTEDLYVLIFCFNQSL